MRISLRHCVTAGLLLLAALAQAHNNPTFREDLLLSIVVNAAPNDVGAHSEPFSLAWEKKTVQLIWRVKDGPSEVRFSIAQNGAEAATDLSHEALSPRLKGDGFTVVNVSGAEVPFTLEIYAKVLDRSKKKTR